MHHPFPTEAPNGSAAQGLTAASRKEEALWLLEKLVPGGGMNNVPFAFRVDGRLRVDGLNGALSLMLRRYPVLRTVFTDQDAHLAKRTMSAEEFAVGVEEIDQGTDDVDRALSRFAGRPFALDGGPLLRAGLMHDEGGDVFCVVVHHLVFDAVSTGIFLQAFTGFYDAVLSGARPTIDELEPLQESGPEQVGYEYWRDQLQGFEPAAPALRCGSPEIGSPTLIGGSVKYEVPARTRALIRQMQTDLRAPEAAILLAAYSLLLTSHGAKSDLVVGAPLDVRGEPIPTAIGYHVNVVPLRLRVDPGAGFGVLVRQARDVLLGAMGHGGVSVDDLSAELPRLGSSWRDTLYRHLFNYVAVAGDPQFTVGGMKAAAVPVENGFSKFDLEFFITSSAEHLELRAVYYTAVLGHEDVEAMLHRFDALLAAAAASPDRPVAEIPIGYTADHEVIAAANRTRRRPAPPGVVEAIRSQVSRTPSATAVVEDTQQVTYEELWRSAAAIRTQLTARGIQPGDLVGVAAPRSSEQIAAVLGVWLAGAVHLPLDACHPAAHLIHQLEDSGAKVVLGGSDATLSIVCASALVPQIALGTAVPTDEEPPAAIKQSSDAIVQYQPGGEKSAGMRVTHGTVANSIGYLAHTLEVQPADAALWSSPPADSRSVLEFLLPLTTGGTVVVAPDPVLAEPGRLRALVVDYDLRTVAASPANWPTLLHALDGVLSGRRLLCTGPLSSVLASRLAATGGEIHQLFGSPFAAISTACRASRDSTPETPTVGRPAWNTQAFIVDDLQRELPVGLVGELCVAGASAGVGCLNAPDLEERRFGEHPVFGRYHRTGVLARWRRDGSLEWAGSLDRQAVVDGSVVGLDGIGDVIVEAPGVEAAAVVAVGAPSGETVVVAFVELAEEAADEAGLADRLRDHVRGRLPATAVPSRIVATRALARRVDHEIDYGAIDILARDSLRSATPGGDGTAEEDDDLTSALLGLWRQLLDRRDLDSRSHFFEEGGYSLLGAKLAQEIEELTSVRLELPEIFENPTPTRLSARLRMLGARLPAHQERQ